LQQEENWFERRVRRAVDKQTGEWIGPKEDSPPTTWVGRLARRWWGRVPIVAVGWTIVGWIFSLPSLTSPNYQQSLRMYLTEFWAWGLITPMVIWLDRRLPFSGKELGKRIGAHLIASAVFTVIYFYIFTTMRAAVGVVPWSSIRPAQIFGFSNLGWYLWSWLICGLIVGALQAYRYYERYMNSELQLERLEHSISEARLNALRMQLDPHFLFNALNTISSHVERDPKLTRRMIEHLGDLLRMSLDSKDRQEVPLTEELALLGHYLEIQKIRFGNQLKVVMDVSPDVKYAAVPSMFIQPLVENAIRHGISRRAAGGTVTVHAAAKDGRLEIRVLDDGVGLPRGWTLESSEGLGLSITRQRIEGLHPNGASSFVVKNREEGGAAVEVVLPLRLVGEEIDERAYA
jgi:two-component system, LytTR family, sensor kinase